MPLTGQDLSEQMVKHIMDALIFSYLSMIPNMTVMAPKNGKELEEMLKFAVEELDGPCAIRYPKGSACTDMEECHEPLKKEEVK